jgi:hypothetical protein
MCLTVTLNGSGCWSSLAWAKKTSTGIGAKGASYKYYADRHRVLALIGVGRSQ